jgi:hypothetical protein
MEPDLLYKYRPFNENTLKILVDGKLYFSSRKGFNDPIDSNPHFRNDLTRENLKKLWEKCSGQWKSAAPESIDVQYFDVCQYYNKLLNDCGILSMSTEWNNPLLWSHYAKEHTGICVGFRRNKAEENDTIYYRPKLGKVYYNKDRTINLSEIFSVHKGDNFQEMKNYIYKAFFSKAPNWWYENEWRYIHSSAKTEYEIPATIEEIIFGLRTPKHIQEIILRVTNDDPGIKYYRMKFTEGSFEMEREFFGSTQD